MQLSDISLLEELFRESGAMLFYPPDKIRENAEEWIRVINTFYRKYDVGSWLLKTKNNGNFIGQCGLNKTPLCAEGTFELGFSILKRYWNKGYATEAAQRCIRLALKKNQINTLIATVEINNVASIRVLSKLPFTFTKMIDRAGQAVRLYQYDLQKEV